MGRTIVNWPHPFSLFSVLVNGSCCDTIKGRYGRKKSTSEIFLLGFVNISSYNLGERGYCLFGSFPRFAI